LRCRRTLVIRAAPTPCRDFAALGIPQPDEATRDLLRALLDIAPPTPAALALAGDALRDDADLGLRRLVPLLATKAWAATIAPAGKAALAARRRKAALAGLAYAHFVTRIAGALAACGVTPLVMKGYAVGRLYHDDPAHRPASDLDIAVPAAAWPATIACLKAQGFHAIEASLPTETSSAYHAHGMAHDAEPFEIDVHRHILFYSPWPGADDGFWARARPFRIGNADALTLSDEDHLLHACLHGCLPNAVSPVRWIIDAALILRRHGASLDWDVLAGEAIRQRCPWPLAACLGYLRDAIGVAVPDAVIARLSAEPMAADDIAFFRARSARSGDTSLPARFRVLWLLYRRGAGASASPLAFLGWLRQRWGLAEGRSLLREAARRLPMRHWRR
jgi:hypothetical protein